MPNFDATIRADYRDVAGLVLDCRSSGLAADGSLWVNEAPSARSLDVGTHTVGANAAALFDGTKNWRTDQLVGKIIYNITDGSLAVVTSNTLNTVTGTLSGGTDNDWDVGDTYAITTPRFGNPYQDVAANQPTVSDVGGYNVATFDIPNADHFKIPLDYAFPAGNWTVAVDATFPASAVNNQTIIGFPNLELIRRDGSGDLGYIHNATSVAGSGDMTDGAWVLAFLASSTGSLYQDNAVELSGSSSLVAIAAGDPAGYICTTNGSSDPSSIVMRGVQIWNRILSGLELDFVYATMDPTADNSAYTRATVTITEWTDNTGTVSRINPAPEAPHRFYLVTKDTGTTARIQISSEVDGHVVPDTSLGGDLFSLTPMETPGVVPGVFSDTGWSSVNDVLLDDEGHYTYLLSRSSGGGIVIHFDVEDV